MCPRYVFKPLASTGFGIQSPYNLNFYKNIIIVTFIDISLRRAIQTFHFSASLITKKILEHFWWEGELVDGYQAAVYIFSCQKQFDTVHKTNVGGEGGKYPITRAGRERGAMDPSPSHCFYFTAQN